jgi:hypothetical protein
MNFELAKLKYVMKAHINFEIALHAIFIEDAGICLPTKAQFKNS